MKYINVAFYKNNNMKTSHRSVYHFFYYIPTQKVFSKSINIFLILIFIINRQNPILLKKMKKFLALKNRIVQSKQQQQIEINRNFSSINSSAYKIRDKQHTQRYKTEVYNDDIDFLAFKQNHNYFDQDCVNQRLFLSRSPSDVIEFDMMTFREEFNLDQPTSSKNKNNSKNCYQKQFVQQTLVKDRKQTRYSLSENTNHQKQKNCELNHKQNVHSCTNRYKYIKEQDKRLIDNILANLSPLEQNKHLNFKISQIKQLLMEVAETSSNASTPNTRNSHKKVNSFKQNFDQDQNISGRTLETSKSHSNGKGAIKQLKQCNKGQLEIKYRRIPMTTCALKNVTKQSLNSSLSIHENRIDCDIYTSQILKQQKSELHFLYETSESYTQHMKKSHPRRSQSDSSQSSQNASLSSLGNSTQKQMQENSFVTQEDANFTSHKNSCEEPSFQFASLDKNCCYLDSYLGIITQREQQQEEQVSQVSKDVEQVQQAMQYYLNSFSKERETCDKEDFEDSIQFRKIHYILQGTTKKDSINTVKQPFTNIPIGSPFICSHEIYKSNLFLDAEFEQNLNQRKRPKKINTENEMNSSITSMKISKNSKNQKNQCQNDVLLKKKVLNDAIDLLNRKYKKKIDFRAN